jgi:hypothetical protein
LQGRNKKPSRHNKEQISDFLKTPSFQISLYWAETENIKEKTTAKLKEKKNIDSHGPTRRPIPGLSYRPARLAKSNPWNRFLGFLKDLKYRVCTHTCSMAQVIGADKEVGTDQHCIVG